MNTRLKLTLAATILTAMLDNCEDDGSCLETPIMLAVNADPSLYEYVRDWLIEEGALSAHAGLLSFTTQGRELAEQYLAGVLV